MKITGVILAGGRGQRLGGIDKGLAPYGGRPLIEWVIARIQPQVDVLVINANRNGERYAAYGVPVIADVLGEFPGPLAGLHAGLVHTSHDWVLTIPCDTPSLPTDLVGRMQAVMSGGNLEVVVAAHPQAWEPTVALYRSTLRPALEDFLARDQRRVSDWIQSRAYAVVRFDSARPFENLNRPEDFEGGQGGLLPQPTLPPHDR